MRENKFQLIYKGLPYSSTDNGFNWHKKVYTLGVLIENSILGICDVHDSCELVAKRQFTGLKDKNGVDIYEGDIINYWSLYQCHSDAVDYFGVEAQNNFPVSEVYLEVKRGVVEFVNGQYSVKNKNIFLIGADVVSDLMNCCYQEQLGMELKEFVYDFHQDGFKSPMKKQLSELEVIGNIFQNSELLI